MDKDPYSYPPKIMTTGPSNIDAKRQDLIFSEDVNTGRIYNLSFSKASMKEKIKQFKLGKYTDKYIRTHLEFILMEGIISNLEYLEYLKEIGEKV